MIERVLNGEIKGNTKALTGEVTMASVVSGDICTEAILVGEMAPVVATTGYIPPQYGLVTYDQNRTITVS